jgi:hypothetical protein
MNEKYYDHIENQRNNNSDRLNMLRKRAEYEYFKNKRITLYGIVFAVIGFSIVFLKDIFLNYFESQSSIIFVISGAITASMGIGLLLYRYLQSGLLNKLGDTNLSEQNLWSEIQDLRVEILKLRKKGSTGTESENISKTINDSINSTLTESFIKSKIDSFYSDKAISESKQKSLLEDFESLGYRINSELARLRRSANLNLVIGTLTTALAITALGYEVFNSEFEITDTVKLLTHYLPRLSLIVFIEIFAFFFLKLYKATLEDIKYFNNEKTNIDFKLISLKTALNNEDPDLIKLVIQELIRTERNFKLSKDESTVELEKIKNDTNNNQILAQLLEKLKQQG